MRSLVTLVCILVLATTAGSQDDAEMHGFSTSQEMQHKCADVAQNKISVASGICMGWITAVREMRAYAQGMTGKKLWCEPAQANNEQVLKVYMRYLDTHPEKLHLAGLLTYVDAMAEAFPCGSPLSK